MTQTPYETVESRLTAADMEIIEQSIGRIAFSRDGTILRVNKRCLALFAYTGWELIGRNRSIFRPALSGIGPDEIEGVFESGQPYVGDLQQLRRDGTTFLAEVSCVLVPSKGVTADEVIMLLRDVTDRRMNAADDAGQIAAINTSQAVIHFGMDGTILHANARFLTAVDYTLDEIVGRHHRMFVDPVEAADPAYAAFWDGLQDGTHSSGEYRRLRKDGQAVWLRATYNPILDLEGRPFKIVKYAVDVTPEKKQTADFQGQIDAIDKSHCVVTFAPDGTIIDANRNFLDTVGYTMGELEGRHHRMFVDPAHAHSLDYEVFWSDLVAGRHRSGEFRRVGKGGRELWFQAIYSPVLDQEGHPFKIVEYATAVTREKLRQADHQGQIAAIHKSQAVVSFNVDGMILDANDNFLDLTGYRLSQVLGRHHSMFVSAEERGSEAYQEFWRDLAMGQHKSGEFKRITDNGREVWLQASYNPILDMNGRPFKVVKNAVDVTRQKLRQGDYEGQITAIHRSQAVITFSLDGTILDANDNFLALMGYQLSEIVGQHHRIFVAAEAAASAEYEAFWIGLREGRFTSAKFRRLARDGSEVWIQATYNPIYDLNGKPFKIVKIASDITADVSLAADLARAQKEVQHDLATGLPNRLGLRKFMRGVLAETDSELALLYLDLDHFKPINDTFGHEIGDLVLRTVAARLTAEMAAGQIVARIGGDEFVVAASNLSRPQIVELAERLIEVVAQPIPHGDRWLEVGLSIGIALTPQDTLEEDELFRFADVALYRTKGTKRGTLTFYCEDAAVSPETERHLAQEMLVGIKARQFDLNCQLRKSDNGDIAVELEPWWTHPTLGRVGPEAFLRVAEQSGLIVPLGDWMLRAACRVGMNNLHVTVCVPIYPKQLLASDLPEMLLLALRESGLDPCRLELRLGRGSARVNPESLRADLNRLQEIGVTIVADDMLLGENLLAAHGSWSMDRVIVDARLCSRLRRQSSPVIDAIEARSRGRGESPRSYEVDREGKLFGFGRLDPVSVDAINAVVERAHEMMPKLLVEQEACP